MQQQTRGSPVTSPQHRVGVVITSSRQAHRRFACYLFFFNFPQPAKVDLNKKSFPKQKTIQNFTIDAQGFRRTKNENPPTWEMGVTSQPVPADLPTWANRPAVHWLAGNSEGHCENSELMPFH